MLIYIKKWHSDWNVIFLFGADEQIRTAYLLITNEVLYRLSYDSMPIRLNYIIFLCILQQKNNPDHKIKGEYCVEVYAQRMTGK